MSKTETRSELLDRESREYRETLRAVIFGAGWNHVGGWEPEYSGLCGDPFAADKDLIARIARLNEAAENA